MKQSMMRLLALMALLLDYTMYSVVSAAPARSPPPANHTLELVQILVRHGERTPRVWETYPRDPYTSAKFYEPWGRGQLTDLGRARARRLGYALRRHYGDFLGPKYSPFEVFAYSKDEHYTKEAAKLLLETLYGNIEKGERPQVHSVPEEIDVLMNSKSCSRYRTELDKARKSAEYLKKLDSYSGMYRYIAKKTNLTYDAASVYDRLYDLYILLESQRGLNLTLPSWCTTRLFYLLKDHAYLNYNLQSQTEPLRRLNGGPLLRRFLNNAKHAFPDPARVYIYSAEGNNVAAFARAINKRFPRVPNYGSAIIMEKWRHQTNTSQTAVRFMVWTTALAEKLFPIQITGCSELCPMESFERLVAGSLPEDEDMRCLLHDLRKGIHSVI